MNNIPRHRMVNWQSLLFAKLEFPVSLVYGETDCVLYSCQIVQEAVTGIDYADQIRGTYHGEAEADALIKKWGGISEYLTQRIGPPLDHILHAQMGDLVILRDGDIEVLGVCVGSRCAFINQPPKVGMRSIRLDLCDRAWPT